MTWNTLKSTTLCTFVLASAGHCLSGMLAYAHEAVSPTDNVAFHRTKLMDAKGKQTSVNLILEGGTRRILAQVAERVVAEIPYSSIDRITYDYSKQHRIKEGAIVMVASLGAGAVVMLTSSKSHWFTVDYHDGPAAKSAVFKLSGKEYKDVLRTARAQTGKEIEFIKDAKL